MTLDNDNDNDNDNDSDNDVDVYFRQALRAPLFIPAYFSFVLTGLKFINELNA